jgi:hypothetical protein
LDCRLLPFSGQLPLRFSTHDSNIYYASSFWKKYLLVKTSSWVGGVFLFWLRNFCVQVAEVVIIIHRKIWPNLIAIVSRNKQVQFFDHPCLFLAGLQKMKTKYMNLG